MTTTGTRLCCERGHEDQRERYPVGAKVRTIVEVVPNVPMGATGKVTGHCDDGRAWIFFDSYQEGHTFHDPALFLTVDSMQPAPETGEEWRTHGKKVVPVGVSHPKTIAIATDEKTAAQIVRDHRLAALVPELMGLLVDARSVLVSVAGDDKSVLVRQVDAALAHAAEKGVKGDG